MMFAEDDLRRFPLRQSLSPGADGGAIFERPGVVEHLSKPASHLVIGQGQGGRIYAANERALKDAQEVVSAAYGRDVVSGAPDVHMYLEPALKAVVEPVMFLRVKVAREICRQRD